MVLGGCRSFLLLVPTAKTRLSCRLFPLFFGFMSAGICPEKSIFQGGEMVFVASVYRKWHERNKMPVMCKRCTYLSNCFLSSYSVQKPKIPT